MLNSPDQVFSKCAKSKPVNCYVFCGVKKKLDQNNRPFLDKTIFKDYTHINWFDFLVSSATSLIYAIVLKDTSENLIIKQL